MRPTKYIVTFQDGNTHTVSAYYMAAAVILAQAKRIEANKSILVKEVEEFVTQIETRTFIPKHGNKAYEMKEVHHVDTV